MAEPNVDDIQPLHRRVLDAASVIRGRSAVVTPAQLTAWRLEVFQLQQEWESTKEILNTWAARVAKREQRALEALNQGPEESPAGTNGPSKDQLRIQAFGG